MTIKITAITASVCAALLCVFATIYPNDPYFFIISSNAVVVVGRLILAAVLVDLAFRKKFRTAYGPQLAAGLAVAFILFGFVGIAVPPIDYSLFSYLKPLDYVFLIIFGLSLELASLTYEPGARRLPRLSRPRNTQLRLFTSSERWRLRIPTLNP